MRKFSVEEINNLMNETAQKLSETNPKFEYKVFREVLHEKLIKKTKLKHVRFPTSTGWIRFKAEEK